MSYEGLRSRLAGGLDGSVVALPDGSIDRYYTVADTAGRIRTQTAFLKRFESEGARSLRLVPETVREGGQAVNAARQADALGGRTRLYGHLDADELGPFPFTAVSMGTPATVHVLSFDRNDLMLPVESADIRDWSLADVFDAADVASDDWVDEGVVVLQNWAGLANMTEAMRDLAAVDIGDGPVVVDPGDVAGTPPDALAPLCDGVATLAAAVPVVLTANDEELAQLATALGVDDGRDGRESRIRSALAVSAVVRHAEPRAVAAVGDRSTITVENFDAERVVRRAGAGDRFDGGLAAGLAAELPMTQALALGNACATHYIEHGTTATHEAVRRLLAGRSPVP